MALKAKGAGHDPYTKKARADWLAMIKLHPDRFDAILYRPQAVTAPDPEELNAPEFGEMTSNQDDIEYQAPILVSAVESNGEDEGFLSSWDGEEGMGYGESSSMLLRLSEAVVPQGSIVEFLVSLSDGQEQRQFWYVMDSIAVGQPAIGHLHNCIPCGDSEQLPEYVEPAPEPAPEPEPEETV